MSTRSKIMKTPRLDRHGSHRAAYEENRKVILETQDICGICGNPVDKSRKHPDPLAPEVDHIIPVSKGGHPSALSNLQLAHAKCNNAKRDKITRKPTKKEEIGNRNLPLSVDWLSYGKSKKKKRTLKINKNIL